MKQVAALRAELSAFKDVRVGRRDEAEDNDSSLHRQVLDLQKQLLEANAEKQVIQEKLKRVEMLVTLAEKEKTDIQGNAKHFRKTMHDEMMQQLNGSSEKLPKTHRRKHLAMWCSSR